MRALECFDTWYEAIANPKLIKKKQKHMKQNCTRHNRKRVRVQPIVSATISGVEILKYPLFHGICFFNESFSFINLVNDFFGKWSFSKKNPWFW